MMESKLHHMHRMIGRLVAASALCVIAAAPTTAQATLPALASVLQPAVSGGGVRAVSFATVTPGVPTAVTITSAADTTLTGVGAFSFTGVGGSRDVQLAMSWGANLVHPITGLTIPYSLNGSYGMYCFDRKTQPPICQAFNPGESGGTSSVVVATPPAPPGGNTGGVRLYLGGALNPPESLGPGVYSTTISVTLTRL